MQWFWVVTFLIFVYPFALEAKVNGIEDSNKPVAVTAPKTNKKIKLKPLKPLSAKDLQKANKKAIEASNGKSIQKANQKVIGNQAKAIRKANKNAEKANKALLKAHAKAIRDAEKQARAEAGKKQALAPLPK
jgi:hypothetical protein